MSRVSACCEKERKHSAGGHCGTVYTAPVLPRRWRLEHGTVTSRGGRGGARRPCFLLCCVSWCCTDSSVCGRVIGCSILLGFFSFFLCCVTALGKRAAGGRTMARAKAQNFPPIAAYTYRGFSQRFRPAGQWFFSFFCF